MGTDRHTPTPGPWAVNLYAENDRGFVQHRIESANEHGIVNDGYIIAEVDGPDAQANARLIAAAPEMHEALKAARETLLEIGRPETNDRHHETFQRIDAALTKSTGGHHDE